MDIYRLCDTTTAAYTFFSRCHGIYTKIDHIRGYKTHINKNKITEIVPCLLSDHNGTKLEISNRMIGRKSQNTCLQQTRI